MVRLAFLLSFMFTLSLNGQDYPSVVAANVPALMGSYGYLAATPTATATATVGANPALVSATIDVTGLILTVVFNQAMTDVEGDWTTDLNLVTAIGCAPIGGFSYMDGDETTTITFSISLGHGDPLGGSQSYTVNNQQSGTIKNLSGIVWEQITECPLSFTVTNNSLLP